MSKDFYPTKERLEDLRQEGVFAYSVITLRFLEIVVLMAIFYFFKKDINFYCDVIRAFLKGELGCDFKELFTFFLIIPSIILPFIILVILLHSRFLFTFNGFFSRPYRYKVPGSLLGIINKLILIPTSCILYIIFVYILSLEFLSLFNNNYDSVIKIIFNNLLDYIFISCAVIFAFLGVLSFIWSKFSFLSKNKMSIQEIEDERD